MADRYEAQLLGTLHDYFTRQQQLVQESLSRRHNIGKSYTKKDWLSDLIDWVKQHQIMAAALLPIINALLIETGQDAIQQVGLQPSQFDPYNTDLAQYAHDRADKIATDVNAETEKQLRAAMSQAQDNGADDAELMAAIGAVFGAALTYRSDRISRTETTRAQGFADINAWDQSGVVTGKEWYTVIDERTCPFCMAQDGKIVSLDSDFYSLGDTVNVDGRSLSINYDDVGEPPLHVNCRCTILPVTLSLSDIADGLD